MRAKAQSIYVAFTIHNFSTLCLLAFLVLTDSGYLKVWTCDQILQRPFVECLCIAMACAIVILSCWAVLLQVEYWKFGFLSFSGMFRFYLLSVITHLTLLAVPASLKLSEAYDDPNVLSIILWSLINLAIGVASLLHIHTFEKKVQNIDFLFFADDAN